MGDWNVADASALLPSDALGAIDALASLASAAVSAAKAELAGVASLPSLPDLPSPAAASATALLDSLEALLTGAKIHVIAIPVAKIPPAPPPSRLPPTIESLEQWLDVTLGPSAETASAYQALLAGTAGNAGFYRAFAESFFDQADTSRPQYFQETDAVTMAVVMAGAPSFAEVSQAASVLDQLFRSKGNAGSLDARVTPRPQNVTAKPVISARGSAIAVKVEWDAPKPAFVPPYLLGLSISVSRYAVIRLVGARSPSVTSVLDVFGTQDLAVGLKNKRGEVVAIGTGTNSSYVDETAPPADGSPVYYCVAWETRTSEPSGASTSKFDKVSTVVKVAQVAPVPSQTGSAPDWSAFGVAAEVFPALSDALQVAIEKAKALASGKPSATSRLSTALTTIGKMAERLETRATDLLADVDALAASLSRPSPGLYLTRVTSSKGGNAFLMSELARRLGNSSDPTRPPFDHSEYVCGVCLVAGAPRLADLAPAIAFLDALFGPPTPANPLLGVLNALDTAVTAAETTVFGPDMLPVDPATTGGVDPLTGKPPVPARPVITDSGKAVASDDPSNPNAGVTNAVPLSELC